MFVDRAKIYIRSGKGGDGAVSLQKRAFCSGGRTGRRRRRQRRRCYLSWQIENLQNADGSSSYKRKYEAENGQNGMKKKRYRQDMAKTLIIKVPVGTVVIDEESDW